MSTGSGSVQPERSGRLTKNSAIQSDFRFGPLIAHDPYEQRQFEAVSDALAEFDQLFRATAFGAAEFRTNENRALLDALDVAVEHGSDIENNHSLDRIFTYASYDAVILIERTPYGSKQQFGARGQKAVFLRCLNRELHDLIKISSGGDADGDVGVSHGVGLEVC